jgi:hypothetical protein
MPFEIKQNDLSPSFVVSLKDDFGEPTEAAVNLTAAGTVFFNMRLVDGAVKIARGTASITGTVTGEVTYNWVGTDTDTAGDYEAEVEIVWNNGKPETFPNGGYFAVSIIDDIA